MFNIFHANLKIPVDFSPTLCDPGSNLVQVPYNVVAESDLGKWLASLNIEITRAGAEQFYTPPDMCIPIHIDGTSQDNKVKLNFQFGGVGSTMKWYKLNNPVVDLKENIGHLGGYITVPSNQVTEIWESQIGQPSLVNTGVLHNIINGSNPRWVISVPLWDIERRQNLQWSRAVEKFAEWMSAE